MKLKISMAKTNFTNYFNNISSVVVNGCTIEPVKGIIDFGDIHFTGDASIGLYLYFEEEQQEREWNVSITQKLSEIKDTKYNNIYKFSAKNFPEHVDDLQNFQMFQIIISEKDNIAKITLRDNIDIIEEALYYKNSVFFRFSYNVNDNKDTQFKDAILYIEEEDSDNYTYINWISPIASGNDIIPHIQNTSLFDRDTSKCIVATSPTAWESSFTAKQDLQIFENYHGKMNSITSKSYVKNNLVRFQDISLNSITLQSTSQPGIK